MAENNSSMMMMMVVAIAGSGMLSSVASLGLYYSGYLCDWFDLFCKTSSDDDTLEEDTSASTTEESPSPTPTSPGSSGGGGGGSGDSDSDNSGGGSSGGGGSYKYKYKTHSSRNLGKKTVTSKKACEKLCKDSTDSKKKKNCFGFVIERKSSGKRSCYLKDKTQMKKKDGKYLKDEKYDLWVK